MNLNTTNQKVGRSNRSGCTSLSLSYNNYIEMDFMKVYSYNQVTAGKSAPVLAKNPKKSANKPAWLK